MQSVQPSPVVDNIRRHMKRLGLSAREVSQKAGLGNTAVHDIISGNSGSARMITLEKIARVFSIDVRDLLAPPHDIGQRHVVPLPIIGAVEAGVWKEAIEWPRSDWQHEPVPDDPRFPGMTRFGFLVRGESMNQLYRPGDFIVCIPMIELQEKPVAGRRYVVYRTNSDGAVEATLKEYQVDSDGREWLVPRSNDVRFSAAIEMDTAKTNGIEIFARVTGVWKREQ